jgi:hypothetical protein
MSPGTARPTRNRWFTTAIALTLLIALVSVITGFISLPFAQTA